MTDEFNDSNCLVPYPLPNPVPSVWLPDLLSFCLLFIFLSVTFSWSDANISANSPSVAARFPFCFFLWAVFVCTLLASVRTKRRFDASKHNLTPQAHLFKVSSAKRAH